MNPRISKKEWGLIKGAIRRVFSRSDLRRKIIDATRIEHSDSDRPRVKKWSRCSKCQVPTPTYEMECDHIEPIVPLHISFHDMTANDLVNRTWCDENNLQGICPSCHNMKSKAENFERRQYKKKKGKSK